MLPTKTAFIFIFIIARKIHLRYNNTNKKYQFSDIKSYRAVNLLLYKKGRKMKFLTQYKNLSREIYILFFGRIVTSMGSLIWPLMTLILKNKLGYDATTIAAISMFMTVLQFPMLLLGGKLADSVSRKKIIIICDMVTVISYIVSGFIPLSKYSIGLFYLAGLFATIEGPSYDALVADLSDGDDREKAYSLQYLGMNLGLVLAPTLGGLLFEKYLGLAFIITGLATFSSTVLIFFFVKQLSVEKKTVSEYEEKRENTGIFTILRERPTLVVYALAMGFAAVVYGQFNYLLPLNMENLYGAKGATIFGFMTSVNAFVVIVATPIVTTFLGKITDVRKVLIGETLIAGGLYCFRFFQNAIPMYFVLMTVFTVGEVFATLGNQPYMTRRIPSTHWGRINSFVNTVTGAFAGLGNIGIGKAIDRLGYNRAWLIIGVLGIITVTLVAILCVSDKYRFPSLYKNKDQDGRSN